MENLAYKYKTADEYLNFERAAVEKREYYKVEVFALSGNTLPHNRQADNSWVLQETANEQDSLFISPIQLYLSISEIYAGVKFKDESRSF